MDGSDSELQQSMMISSSMLFCEFERLNQNKKTKVGKHPESAVS